MCPCSGVFKESVYRGDVRARWMGSGVHGSRTGRARKSVGEGFRNHTDTVIKLCK